MIYYLACTHGWICSLKNKSAFKEFSFSVENFIEKLTCQLHYARSIPRYLHLFNILLIFDYIRVFEFASQLECTLVVNVLILARNK